ncbi:MAG: glycosyltransferase family 4 protein [Anaerolineales bacterium]
MKLLLINSEYPPVGGGAGNATANIARELAHMGNDVMVVTSRFGQQPACEVQDGVDIRRIPALRRRQDRSTVFEQLVFILSASFRTLSLVRDFQPDATLAFFGIPSGAVAWLLREFHGIPYVVSLRGGDVPGFRPYDFQLHHKLMSPFLRCIWKDAGSVVANSSGLREMARRFDSSVEIPVIPNGVDLEKFSLAEREWTPPRLLSVGRVVYQKGLDLAMRALAELKSQPWEWRIAGDGPQMNSLKKLAAELGIEDRIRFAGWQSKEQLRERYQQANLFLFPSRHEGMPNAILEAMACGLPVIATQIAGNEELVVKNKTGLLVPPEDVDTLREALQTLLPDSARRFTMGQAARRRVEEHYSWTRVAEGYARLFEDLIE